MKKLSSAQKKTLWKLGAAAVLLVAALAVLWIVCAPYVQKLSTPEGEEQLRNWIDSLGFKGWLLFLALQIMQIVIAFIPGEPVQLVAGMLYGTWGGMLTCLLGSVLASALVFFAVRKAGDRLVLVFFGKDKLEEFAFLRDSQKIETIIFFLFLIPGVPKDLLTYLAGLTPIKFTRFLIIANLARIPALTASTLMGSSAGSGNWGLTVALLAAAAAVLALGVVYRKRFMSWIRRRGENPPAERP